MPGTTSRGVQSKARALPIPVETKLLPPVQHFLIPRRELLDSLAPTRRRLTLLRAPAGYGKTALLGQWWSMESEASVAWLSLDDHDNDPSTFWAYVIEAFRRAHPQLGAQLDAGAAREVSGKSADHLIDVLERHGNRQVLVLDDVHVLTNTACLAAIEDLLLGSPTSFSAVLSGRRIPTRLTDVCSPEAVRNVGREELSFSAEETAAALSMLGHRLTRASTDLLVDRTEGWPAGVYLAANSLHEDSSADDQVAQFGGDNRAVIDYLTESVLEGEPPPTLRFLEDTSLLDRFTYELCGAVTGAGGSKSILDRLAREDGFLKELPGPGKWFRYQRMFRDALYASLVQKRPEAIPDLHIKASRWLEQHGFFERAIDHAVAAGDSVRSSRLIAEHWGYYLGHGSLARTRPWLESLGDQVVEADPDLAVVGAWLEAVYGNLERSEQLLAAAEKAAACGVVSLEEPAMHRALLRSFYSLDGVASMLDLAGEAIGGLTPESPWYGRAALSLGIGRFLSGAWEGARVELEKARRFCSSDPMSYAYASTILSLIADELGRFGEAEELVREAEAVAEAAGIPPTRPLGPMLAAQAQVRARKGKFGEAAALHEKALALRMQGPGLAVWPTLLQIVLAIPVMQSLGDEERARALLERGRGLANRIPDPGVLATRLEELERSFGGGPVAGIIEPLTDREVVVLRVLAGGMSQRDIARELSISPNTLKTHLRTIYRKLGVASRSEAIRLARERKLLS